MSQVYIKELLWRFEQLINGYFYLISGRDNSKHEPLQRCLPQRCTLTKLVQRIRGINGFKNNINFFY